MLEQDITKKGRINKLFPKPEPEFDTSNNKEYKVEVIIDSTVYAKEEKGNLSGLYYLIFWKGYLVEKSIWEPSSTVIYLRKIIFTFYKNYPEKLTVIFLPLDSAPLMVKPLVKPVKPSAK